jgi:hypothetical protein
VQDYQNFLSSGKQQLDITDDMPSVIIVPETGPTHLADALAGMGMGDDLVLTPSQDLPDSMGGSSEYPIYVTLPPYALEGFLVDLPESYRARPDDFVFFSGGLDCGNIEDVLKDRGKTWEGGNVRYGRLVLLFFLTVPQRLLGYCRDSMTQVLISGMGVTSANTVLDIKVSLGIGENGEEKLAGECAACGKWAGSIARRLERSNVFCRTDFYREWRRRMWERSVYDAVLNAIGAVRSEPTTMADVANYYDEEVATIVWELSQLLRGWRAITLTYGFEDRILAIGEFAGSEQPCRLDPVSMYPYVWGNPVFLESKTFVEYLQFAQKERGLLPGIDLPVRSDEDYTSKMRQGNLRADGVI